MCCCDKYASLGKEKRRQQPRVSPSHRKNLRPETQRWKHNRILSWGKSAESSTDFIVPVYISWGPCQHSNSMKFCSWLAPFNSGLREAEFDMFFDGWRWLFYITNLVYFIRNSVTQMEKWEEFKNTTIFRHPDACCLFFFSLSFLIWPAVYLEVLTNWLLPLPYQSFHRRCAETTVFMLKHPTAGKFASHSNAGAL